MKTDCIFCKIANNEFKTEFLYESDSVVIFKDITPQAPVHWLVVPKAHYASLKELEDMDVVAEIFSAIKTTAKKLGVESYRTVLNTGKQAGQEVFHIHFHVLSGRDMNWPPG